MLTAWSSVASVIYRSLLDPDETITAVVYSQQTDEMYHQLRSMCLGLITMKGLIFLHSGTGPHVAQRTLL